VTPRTKIAALCGVPCVLLALLAHHARSAPTVRPVPAFSYARAGASGAAGTFRFDASVTPVNRQAFLNVTTTQVRPEAMKLFDRVAGLVTVVDGPVPSRAIATTQPTATGYTIEFQFGPLFHRVGQRGFNRVVEHELGHVIDFALLNPALRAQLDAQIPAGVPCTGDVPTGSCAPREERFAETFAKWASGDIGVNAAYGGYAVPPPADLDAWGAPLAAIADGRSG
jgi:hypothetical protein